MLTIDEVHAIRNHLTAMHMAGKLEDRQVRKTNSYLGTRVIYVGGYAITSIRSYQTIVGFVVLDSDHRGVYEVGKYSVTTSKQFNDIYRVNFGDFPKYYFEP